MTTTSPAVYPVSGKFIPTRFLKLDLRNEDLRQLHSVVVHRSTPTFQKLRARIRTGKRASLKCSHAVLARAGIRIPKGLVVDHINGDTLDDRLENLRVVPQSINRFNSLGENQRKQLLPRGVTHPKDAVRSKPFHVTIGFQRKTIYVGWFATSEEAHQAWKRKALELYGSLPYSITP